MNYCSWCKERLYPENPEVGFTDFRTKRYYPPLCQGCSHFGENELDDLKDRIGKLEAISALPGQIPRQYQDKLQQLQGEVTHIHKLHHERQATRKIRYKQYTT